MHARCSDFAAGYVLLVRNEENAMKKSLEYPVGLAAVLAVLTALPLLNAVAQDAPSSRSSGPSTSQSVNDNYYQSVKAGRDDHQKNLAEIDRQYEEALRQFREENIRRAQALPAQNTAAHKDLAGKGLTGGERQAEYDRIQAEHKQSRAEYAQWRDSTSQRLREEHANARDAQLNEHQLKLDQLLAERNANLARLRAPDGVEIAGRGSPAPGNLAERSDKSFRDTPSPAAGAGVAGAGAGATGNIGTGAAGASVAGAGAAVTETTGAGITGASTAGLGTAAGETSTVASDSAGGGSGFNTARESAPAATGDTGVSDTVAGTTGGGVDTPERDDSGEYFEYGDGSLVRAEGPDGEVGQVNNKGDIVYGDGTTIVHTGDREITIHRPDGSSSTRQLDAGGKWKPTDSRSAEDYPRGTDVDAPVRTDNGDSFVYDDGATVRAFGPEGDLGKLNDKGDIVFVDGTTIVHTGEREITIHRPDGSSRTERADESGEWQPVGSTKPHSEGKGSNEKYVGTSSGGQSSGGASGNSGSSSDSGSGSSQSGPRGSSGSSSSSSSSSGSKDGKGSKDSSSGNDSDDSGSADGGSGESDSSESTDDADTQGEGKEYYGEAGPGRSAGPSDVIQGIVDRATGQSTDPETGVPEPCGESGGFGVTQPGPGGSGNCIPGHLPTVSEDNDQQPDTPDVGASVDAEDMRRAGDSGIAGRITQPGLGEQGIPIEDLPSQSGLDQSPVVNPPPQ